MVLNNVFVKLLWNTDTAAILLCSLARLYNQRYVTQGLMGHHKIKMADESTREYFEKLSKEKLIDKVLELQRENEQLLLRLPSTSLSTESSVKSHDLSGNDSEKAKKPKQNKSIKREFDFKKYNKRHVALMVAYLGWDMHGFAAQENVSTTIEAYLFDALIKAKLVEGREGSNYSRCGRTDKGVSAFRQVVSLDVRSNMADGVGVIKSDGFVDQRKGISPGISSK